MLTLKSLLSTLTSTKKIMSGISIDCPKLQDLTVTWVKNFLIKKKSKVTTPFQTAHIILFDSQKKTLPLKFLQNNTTQLTLLEAIQHDANVQRDFVAKYLISQQKSLCEASSSVLKSSNFLLELKSNKNFVSSLLAAYHASAKDLLVSSKSKPYNERFLKRVFLSDVEYFAQIGVSELEIETIVIGCLASPTLQITLLNSLFKQYIIYLYNYYKNFNNQNIIENELLIQSVFNISKFTLITFLNYSTFAQFICGKADLLLNDSNSQLCWAENTLKSLKVFNFFAKSHRHFSFLFNLFFEVILLNEWNGFNIKLFSPIPPAFKEIKSKTEKLENIGLKRNEFYAVQIRPRSKEELNSILSTVDIDFEFEVNEILLLGFWMVELTPNLRGSKPYNDELKKLFESYDLTVNDDEKCFDENCLVNEIYPQNFFTYYRKVRNILFNGITTSKLMQKKYSTYRNQFLKTTIRDYVD